MVTPRRRGTPHKPGAGGAIGASHVVGQERLALLGTAAAYFVRPYLYKDTPYNFDQFRPVHVMANSPAIAKMSSLNGKRAKPASANDWAKSG